MEKNMKKILKNKKGFTLIELLAVIVVLAIIMVIATQQVNSTIKKSRANSFVSSYKMIVKEIKSRMAMSALESGTTIECNKDTCPSSYDISAEDYEMTVVKIDDSYILTLKGTGKFENMSLGTESGDVKCPVTDACENGQKITVKINSDGTVVNGVVSGNTNK